MLQKADPRLTYEWFKFGHVVSFVGFTGRWFKFSASTTNMHANEEYSVVP